MTNQRPRTAAIHVYNTVDPDGEAIGYPERSGYDKYFKDTDLHKQASNFHRASATNIYRYKDERYFHLHGSMNPESTQDSLGLPRESVADSVEESWKPYTDAVGELDSAEMQRSASDVYKQAGTICWTTEEFGESEDGKKNAHIVLYEIHDVKNENQPACWWPDCPQTSAQRPLAGLKVVDLTRVIAAPALTRGLAGLGTSVMRVTAEHITDMSALHVDPNWETGTHISTFEKLQTARRCAPWGEMSTL